MSKEDLDKAIGDLKNAFDAVKDQIAQTYPAIWGRACAICMDDKTKTVDTDAAVRFLLQSPRVGFGTKSLIDVADEHGQQSVLDYIAHVEYGGYA